jgi:putative addiction module component (TIGR02574 family)
MSLPIDRLKSDALELSSSERAELAHVLIASLDEESHEDPAEVERAWAEEIERRMAEYHSGAVRPIPAAEVFAEARSRLR